jgi:hypothetical protein
MGESNNPGGKMEKVTPTPTEIASPEAAVATDIERTAMWIKVLDTVEQPLVLTALFTIGGLVGALLFTPAFILCAVCILLGIHRSKIFADQHWKTQLLIYCISALLLAMSGYFLNEALDARLDKIQTEFAKKVASFISKGTNESGSPLFAVDIEHRMLSAPGAVTSYWFATFGPSACSLEPTGTAVFLRLTNLQRRKEMIAAYSIQGLRKIQLNHGRMFVILPRGQIGTEFVPRIIDFGAPSGMGMMVNFPVDDVDTSRAIPVTGDFLDYKIGEGHYLEPDEPVRGWVFFEHHKDQFQVPGHLTINITDQFQHNFSYLIPDHIGDPEGDILSRRFVEGALEDLSRCAVVR